MHNKMYRKLVGLQFKNPYKMLPTMHIWNINTLETLSTLIDTVAYVNNSLPLYADTVLHRER